MPESEVNLPVVGFEPGRWGDPAHPMLLSDGVIGALAMLGIDKRETRDCVPPVAPESRLSETSCARLRGTGVAVDNSDTARIRHLRGYSTPDLLKFRAGDATDAPDAVVCPRSADEVAAVLEVCASDGLTISPYSGGTSVTGGLAPERTSPVLALDLSELSGLVDLDETSHVATFAAGTRLPDAERLLGERGFELGHFPQSYEGATIGGCAVTRSAGQSSIGYGRFDEMVVGLTVVTPIGVTELGTAPKSAAGPDLRQLFLGSEGAFGVVTAVRVRVHPVPQVRRFEGWHFPDFHSGAEAARRVAQGSVRPTVLGTAAPIVTVSVSCR